jgi:predicted DNA-binding transcriptional regulator YafY
MYNPATRLLTILELLQSHDQMSGTEIAERLEVDKRSVRRYVVMLQDMGIPIEGMPGAFGGYRLRSGFKLPPLMLNENEATVVTLGLLGIQRLGFAIQAETVAAALAKIQRVLPQAIRERVQSLDSALVLDNPQPVTVGGTNWLLDVSEAVTLRRSVEMQYRAETGEETSRVVDPYGVATRAGLWYLVGFCHLRDGMRMFRLERIQALAITERVFDPPATFDSLRFVLDSIARVPARWPVDILLDLSFADAEARIPPGYAVLQPIEHGVRLGGEFNDLPAVARFLVGLDCRFEIVEPEELRAEVRQLGRKLIDLASAVEPTFGKV